MMTQSLSLKSKRVVTGGIYHILNPLMNRYLKNGKQRNCTNFYGNTRSYIFPYRRTFGYRFRSTSYNFSITFWR